MKSAGSSVITDSSNGSSPFKKPLTGGSSRVIESLHQEIDVLKDEQIKLKNQNQELKKSYELVGKRRDELLEQLSNSKHENEMVNSLLQRKQRRINDLEESLSDITYKSDDMNIKLQSLETRCNKLSESEAKSTAEYERIKIAYDAIVLAQQEYRSIYETEIKQLKENLAEFVESKESQITKNLTLINKSDSTIYRSIKSIALRSNEIEEKTEERHVKVQESLHELLSSVEEQTSLNQELFDSAKVYFHKFSENLNISEEELIEAYNEKFKENQVNPEILISPGSESIVESSNGIKIKKRGERTKSTADQRTLSVEQRISSLTKDLNHVIPTKDRNSVTPQIMRIKSVKRSTSKQGSEILASSPTTPQTPQRQQTIHDNHTPSKPFNPLNIESESSSAATRLTSGSTEKTSPEPEENEEESKQETSVLELDDDFDESNPPDSAGSKKKRRRRRRRKNKTATALEGEESPQNEEE